MAYHKPFDIFPWMIGSFIISIIALIVAMCFASQKDRKEWEAFRDAHKCKVVAKRDGQYVYTKNGGWTDPQTGWLCDDGITYFKDN